MPKLYAKCTFCATWKQFPWNDITFYEILCFSDFVCPLQQMRVNDNALHGSVCVLVHVVPTVLLICI